ncbi:hypothetical protein NESM_000184500 [Novymonas esmeraldas]|uniref:Uncharacterized protein n=1 Tax=Novymonas esmeraldas TaxID=1808958 RepID=A0AAW0F6D6_9TRYP
MRRITRAGARRTHAGQLTPRRLDAPLPACIPLPAARSASGVAASSSPAEESLVVRKARLMTTTASARAMNRHRLRELLHECTPEVRQAVCGAPAAHRRRDVWPRAAPVDAALPPLSRAGTETDGGLAVDWYGAPPGTCMETAYFSGHQSQRWRTFFHDNYYTRREPTAPLLRCPACVAARLRGDASAPPPLWMEPESLQRHLSYIHAAELFTPQELRPYNAQVTRELQYSCGLAPASPHTTTSSSSSSIGATPGAWKPQPACVVMVVDSANVELSSAAEMLEMLRSPKVRRTLSDFPVAVCVTHEIFMPATSKTLHALFQLARLHPASTLHLLLANTSLESGDLLTSSVLSHLLLASPRRAVPPVVLLTSDLQQSRALTDMFGGPALGSGCGGQVHWVKPLTAAQLIVDLQMAVEASQDLV